MFNRKRNNIISKSLALLMIIMAIMSYLPSNINPMVTTAEALDINQNNLDQVVQYYKDNKTNLNDWQEMVGLTKAGEDISQLPWQPNLEIDSLAIGSDVLDFAKKIMSLHAAGNDPKSIEGRDITNELSQKQLTDGSFGVETRSTYWSMIALDDVQATYNTNSAIVYLLSQQSSNGGFSWAGLETAPDVDSTGAVLMALANHRDYEGVNVAVEKAIDYLKAAQMDNGGFGTSSIENCESTSFAIMGLIACNETITLSNWIKNGNSMVDALLSYQLTDGSFCHIKGTASNTLSTRQALMALAVIVNEGIGGTGDPVEENPSNESTIRVRVEGHTESLADKTVTVTGTAIDALVAAVGSEQIELDDSGFITGIMGESGQKDINTSWMYYVIRNGEIEPGSFDLGSASYNVNDGDEIVFYIGAFDESWNYKVCFPQVNISPDSITEGQTVTMSISAKKYEYPVGLSDLTYEESAAIGNYTVEIDGKTYTSSYGQVIIANVPKGETSFVVKNSNDYGFPDVITYCGSFIVGDAIDNSIRVRVEGHTESLADKTVTVNGTAIDALVAAVGSEQIELDDSGFITGIMGESGQKDINTSWMYYVIRNGEIEPGSFDLGSASYNVNDGDEIVFYIGAFDESWNYKVCFPQVTIRPDSITEGQTVTMSISAQKYVYFVGLSDLTDEESTAIGNYTVEIDGKTYTSNYGQVVIANVPKGETSFVVKNSNDNGYPDVITYKGSFITSSLGGNTQTDKINVKVAVIGKDGEIIYVPKSVSITSGDTYGYTAMGALDATGLSWKFGSTDGFVDEIDGEKNQGMNGWMYSVNGISPSKLATNATVNSGSKVLWWYSTSAMEGAPDWPSSSSTSTTVASNNTDEIKEMLKNYSTKVKSVNVVLNSENKMTVSEAEKINSEVKANNVSLSSKYTGEEVVLTDGEVSMLLPADVLDDTTTITVNELKTADNPRQYAIKLNSSVYEFGPNGTKFNEPIILSIKIAIDENTDLDNMCAAWFDEDNNKWIPVPSVIDVETGMVTFETDHFTKYAVIETEKRVYFDDVNDSISWAKDAIEILAGQGVINGTSDSFYPQRSVTRAEFIKIIVKALDLKMNTSNKSNFSDIDGSEWYADYVECGYENNIITGDPDGNFRPNDVISRNEIAVVLSRLQQEQASYDDYDLTFNDNSSVPEWAMNGVKFAVKEKLMNGYDSNVFMGLSPMTRAEVVTVTYRYLNSNLIK